MPYRFPSQNAADDAELDQFRINRLGGAQEDYQLAQIANEHPDWTPDQVRLAAQGKLGGAPSTRLLTGYGLPARYRITGADPQAQPPINAANNYKLPANTLRDSISRQENQFRLNQISRAQAQLDKLDPSDDDNSDKIEELKNRIQDFKSQSGEVAQPVIPAAIPLGEGTAGEVAPVYQAGGPAAFKRLSNGGSVYFGPAGGAPAFSVRPQIQDMPAAGTVSGSPAIARPAQPTITKAPEASNLSLLSDAVSSAFPFAGSFNPARAATSAKSLYDNIAAPAPEPPAPTFKITPSQIKKRIAITRQINALGDAPDEFKKALNDKLEAFDSSVTNPAPFKISGGQPAVDNALGELPDSGPQIPPSHIEALKQNPDKSADFDALYGQGQAAKILGQ